MQSDYQAFRVIRRRAPAHALLICDHASNRVPAGLANLGLSPDTLNRHIGWDIGAAQVTRWLSLHLGATAVLSGVSRLVIDCNRPIGHPTSIPDISDGVPIPGSQGLDEASRDTRARRWFHPYHRAIDTELARLDRTGAVAALISIHSFTPSLNGRARPWTIGVLWDRDPRLALDIMAALTRQGEFVGDNEPYSGRGGAYTMDTHASAQGRPHVTFEIRQDLISGAAGAHAYGRKLASILGPLLFRCVVSGRKFY